LISHTEHKAPRDADVAPSRSRFDASAPAGRFSRVYCGGSSQAACRDALRGSLRDAIGVSGPTSTAAATAATTPTRVRMRTNRDQAERQRAE
jgi:hypothetical protein